LDKEMGRSFHSFSAEIWIVRDPALKQHSPSKNDSFCRCDVVQGNGEGVENEFDLSQAPVECPRECQ